MSILHGIIKLCVEFGKDTVGVNRTHLHSNNANSTGTFSTELDALDICMYLSSNMFNRKLKVHWSRLDYINIKNNYDLINLLNMPCGAKMGQWCSTL